MLDLIPEIDPLRHVFAYRGHKYMHMYAEIQYVRRRVKAICLRATAAPLAGCSCFTMARATRRETETQTERKSYAPIMRPYELIWQLPNKLVWSCTRLAKHDQCYTLFRMERFLDQPWTLRWKFKLTMSQSGLIFYHCFLSIPVHIVGWAAGFSFLRRYQCRMSCLSRRVAVRDFTGLKFKNPGLVWLETENKVKWNAKRWLMVLK